MNIPEESSFSTIISVSVTLAILWLFVSYICTVFEERQRKQERERWKKFKKDNNCVLIEIDETGFFGKKYTWKTKDGVTITNKHKN